MGSAGARGFHGLLPSDRRYVFEFRHESWFDEEVYDAMRERDIAMCLAEQEDFRVPVVSTASWGYLRLHRLDYDEAALVEWAKRCSLRYPHEAVLTTGTLKSSCSARHIAMSR